MLLKVLRFIFGSSFFSGLIIMIGTAGASDCNLIDGKQITIRMIIAIIFLAIGVFGLNLTSDEFLEYMEECENE